MAPQGFLPHYVITTKPLSFSTSNTSSTDLRPSSSHVGFQRHGLGTRRFTPYVAKSFKPEIKAGLLLYSLRMCP